jgi:hypothetical protein
VDRPVERRSGGCGPGNPPAPPCEIGDIRTSGPLLRHSVAVGSDEVPGGKALDSAVRLGLVAYGLVHLLLAFTALRLAFGEHEGKADQEGALAQLAQSGFGQVALLVVAAGFGALVVWQAAEAVLGHGRSSGAERLAKRVGSAGRALVYLLLAGLALQQATRSGSGGQGTDSVTARVMSATGGRFLIGAVGVAIVGLGLYLCYYGLAERFVERLDLDAHRRGRRPVIVTLGTVGHVAKGIAFGVVGGLFVTAAVQFQPRESGGLDEALRTLLQQPLGPYLVSAVALGLGCFGLYCLAWARHQRA